MKKKITFPDWTGPAGQIITRDGENGKRPIWRAYAQDVYKRQPERVRNGPDAFIFLYHKGPENTREGAKNDTRFF